MPALFALALVAFAFGVLGVMAHFFFRDDDGKAFGVLAAVGGIVLGVVLTIGASVNSVPVRNVGIVTSFNKPTGEVTGSGLTWVKPWEKVGEWDASRQQYDFRGDNCIRVRTATLADACVEGIIEWQVKPENAPNQFSDYKGEFDRFLDKRVHAAMQESVRVAFTDYNPLLNIDAKTGNLNVPLKPVSERVKGTSAVALSNDLTIHSVVLSRVNHDDKTEGNIKAFQDKLAQTRNLEQDQKNAEIQKRVTETNAKVDKVTRCLEIAEKVGANPGLCLNPGIVMGAK